MQASTTKDKEPPNAPLPGSAPLFTQTKITGVFERETLGSIECRDEI
jgi:hypothetical protein